MWTDGHNEANSRFSQFCDRAKKLLCMCPSRAICFPAYESICITKQRKHGEEYYTKTAACKMMVKFTLEHATKTQKQKKSIFLPFP
jgi:hypothetical protein